MRHHFEIFDPIVVFDSVLVMNVLERFEIAAKVLFHDDPMFGNVSLRPPGAASVCCSWLPS